MEKLKLMLLLFFVSLFSCNENNKNKNLENLAKQKEELRVYTESISAKSLPKEIYFEGNPKDVIKLIDINGEHIVILTETGEIPSQKIIDQEDASDFKIFAYDYLFDKKEKRYKLNWKIQDFILNCQFDLVVGFLKNTFKVTDLNKNGVAEIWTMYSMNCTSDVSPAEMKIIMYEGKQKFALRGNGVVNLGVERIGGDYKMDENLLKSSKEVRAFALKMWEDNNERQPE